MEEPSFAANDAAKGFSRRYRLLVLPSFTPAYSIRVDYPAESAANASGDLTAVTETGAGGYDPGAKVPLWSFAINERAARRLDEAVKEAKIAEQPWRFKHPVKDGEIVICADGTTYVFESLDGEGSQQIVSRHQCDLNADQSMTDILFQMHRLGRLTIPYEIMQIIVSR